MKIWLLVLIVNGTEHKVGTYESMPACSEAGAAIFRAANEAYGELSPNLRFHCSRKVNAVSMNPAKIKGMASPLTASR